MRTMIRPPRSDVRSADEIARTLKLDKGLGFLVRLLDTRVHLLYEQLTGQNDITPRQFGVLLTLHQQGTLTLTELAGHIRVDRSTLGEMINRMAERSLITKRNNGNDRRSAEVLLAPAGKMVPAGLEASKGLVTTQFLKQPGDPAWANDEEAKSYKEFLKKYAPSANPDDYSVLVAYMNVHGVTLALKKCGDELTRENLIRQATSLQGERLPMMLPGISISTKPDDYAAFKTLRIAVFDGTSWTL